MLECPDTKAPADWARAYHKLLRLPAVAFRRILGPHWLPVCVPSILLTVWEIHRRTVAEVTAADAQSAPAGADEYGGKLRDDA